MKGTQATLLCFFILSCSIWTVSLAKFTKEESPEKDLLSFVSGFLKAPVIAPGFAFQCVDKEPNPSLYPELSEEVSRISQKPELITQEGGPKVFTQKIKELLDLITDCSMSLFENSEDFIGLKKEITETLDALSSHDYSERTQRIQAQATQSFERFKAGFQKDTSPKQIGASVSKLILGILGRANNRMPGLAKTVIFPPKGMADPLKSLFDVDKRDMAQAFKERFMNKEDGLKALGEKLAKPELSSIRQKFNEKVSQRAAKEEAGRKTEV